MATAYAWNGNTPSTHARRTAPRGALRNMRETARPAAATRATAASPAARRPSTDCTPPPPPPRSALLADGPRPRRPPTSVCVCPAPARARGKTRHKTPDVEVAGGTSRRDPNKADKHTQENTYTRSADAQGPRAGQGGAATPTTSPTGRAAQRRKGAAWPGESAKRTARGGGCGGCRGDHGKSKTRHATGHEGNSKQRKEQTQPIQAQL